MKLHGNRIFLELPKKEESKLIVDQNTKEAVLKEMVSKMSKLKVYKVGDIVTNIKEGDIVLVDMEKLRTAPIIDLGEGVEVAYISSFDVILTWEK